MSKDVSYLLELVRTLYVGIVLFWLKKIVVVIQTFISNKEFSH